MTKPSIVVSGHGTFADGIKGALNLLASIPDNWYFVNFKSGMSDEELKEKFANIQKKIGSEHEIVYFTDLAGGTPYKVAASFAYQSNHIEVIAGCNLGSLLEILYSEIDSAGALSRKMLEISKSGINRFEMNSNSSNDTVTNGDGI